MMKQGIQIVAAVMTLLVSQSVPAAAPAFKEGQWETRYRMEMIGMPMPIPPISAKQTVCLGPERYIPDNAQPNQQCQVHDAQVSGNSVSWTLRCQTPQGTIEGRGSVTYQSAAYDGVMEAKMVSSDASSPAVRYRYIMSGQRLGACPK